MTSLFAFQHLYSASTWITEHGVSVISISADFFRLTSNYIDNLDVHFLRDVVWNTEAFKLLVVPDQTKLLVQAVVMNQLRSTESADIIPGKGNGLFILLHG
jgi:hypothetical protein